MFRVFVTIVLPLVLPTALYLGWMWFAGTAPRRGEIGWRALPWPWLAAVGVLLAAIMLFIVMVGFGTSQPGIYVPPHSENGRIIPGHIEPRPAR
ncbi:MAG TPA: DUF6111 family protein [Stellaceae bacterium]|nr:DUF6111 family protein [Stellaceae bacterium]